MEETFKFFVAAAAFLTVGLVMVFYEVSRTKAGRPIGGGSHAVQLYYMIYLVMFALAITAAAKAIVG